MTCLPFRCTRDRSLDAIGESMAAIDREPPIEASVFGGPAFVFASVVVGDDRSAC